MGLHPQPIPSSNPNHIKKKIQITNNKSKIVTNDLHIA
jgi:hypothetical protein